jgi:hypothetical protein
MNVQKHIFDALVQWCLVFDQPLSRIAINDSTCCSLHGMIEWQNLNSILSARTETEAGQRERAMAIFDRDSTIVADGIFCTLGELQEGRVKARLLLEVTGENSGSRVVRDISWRDIAKAPLQPWLLAVQEQIREHRRDDGRTVSLSGLVKSAGYLNERSLKYTAALAASRGMPLGEVPLAHVQRAVIHELINRKEYIGRGNIATLALYNDLGEIIGTRSLTVA